MRGNRQALTAALILSNCRSEDALDDDACMVWRFGVNSNGIPYGQHEGRSTNLRRLMWRLSHEGCEFPVGLMASVTCLNPRCLNPRHILPLQRKAVQRAWAAAGVYTRPADNHKRAEGRRNAACAKLTHELAQQIRDLRGHRRAKDIGAEFGISKQMVWHIWQGVCWAPTTVANASVFSWRPAA